MQIRSIFWATIFASLTASASLTITTSDDFETPVTTTNTTIYAGGTDNTACGTTTTMCDSCAASTDPIGAGVVCSHREVKSTTKIHLQVTATSVENFGNSTGMFCISKTNNSWQTISTLETPWSVSANGNTRTASITFSWSDICKLADGAAAQSCTGSFQTPMYIGWSTTTGCSEAAANGNLQVAFRYVDKDNHLNSLTFDCASATLATDYSGPCDFRLFPGDKKLYILDVVNNPSNPSLAVPDLSTVGATTADPSGITYKGIEVYVVEDGQTINMNSNSATLSFVNKTTKITPTYIEGLTNGIKYDVGMAAVDQAGILTFFGTTGLEETPQPVYGLLSGQGCFIATAAYGSSMAPEVETFRQFRSEILMHSEVGLWFARTYYKYSPAIAEVIAQSEVLKFFSRVILWPMLIFVKMSLAFGVVVASGLFAAMIAAIWWAFRTRHRWRPI